MENVGFSIWLNREFATIDNHQPAKTQLIQIENTQLIQIENIPIRKKHASMTHRLIASTLALISKRNAILKWLKKDRLKGIHCTVFQFTAC